jgi:hypothetical protein
MKASDIKEFLELLSKIDFSIKLEIKTIEECCPSGYKQVYQLIVYYLDCLCMASYNFDNMDEVKKAYTMLGLSESDILVNHDIVEYKNSTKSIEEPEHCNFFITVIFNDDSTKDFYSIVDIFYQSSYDNVDFFSVYTTEIAYETHSVYINKNSVKYITQTVLQVS